MNPNQPQKAVTEPEIEREITVFASLLVAAIAKSHVSRQPSNARGRKGKTENPFGIQAPDGREVRHTILHHQPGWECCSSLSLRGMAEDRGEAGAALKLQSDQEEVFESHQLLRPTGGDGWTGTAADSGPAARLRRDQRGSGRCRKPDIPGCAEHGAVPEGHPGQPVYG